MVRLDLDQAIYRQLKPESTVEFRDFDWLLERAKQNPPKAPTNIVSDFSAWVFGLCFEKRFSPVSQRQSIEIGRSGERLIQDRKLWRNQLPAVSAAFNQWTVDYQDPLDDSRDYFVSTKLKVNGKKLAGRPDVVLKKKHSREIMIIERKVTRSTVPVNGWPNLQTQLWCYRWLDRWRRSEFTYLIGDIWVSNNGSLYKSSTIPRWDGQDQQFDERCAQLFELYGGTIG